MEFKKIVYICHPIAGNVQNNIDSILAIQRKINLEPKYADVVPFTPYLSDVLCLNDKEPTERHRGISNGLYLISCRFINEIWVFGDRISAGMKGEILAAFANRIPVVAKNKALTPLLEELAAEYELSVKNGD